MSAKHDTKRRTLLISGAASIVVMGGMGTMRLHSNLEDARHPWKVAGLNFEDRRLRALSYAILSPSPHNRQPWLVQLTGQTGLTLYCDTDRLLPETDPFNRQITLGLGAFIHLLEIAAAEDGAALKIDCFPEGEAKQNLDKRPVAHIEFMFGAKLRQDPLFQFVRKRRTNRTKFYQKPVELTSLETLGRDLNPGPETNFGYTINAHKIAGLKEICTAAWEVELTTPRTHHESTRLTRVGEKEINANPDGISLFGPLMEGLGVMGQLTEEKMNDPETQAFAGSRKFYTDLIASSQAFAWIVTPDNSRKSQLRAGADWLRLHLAATRDGIALQPLSQALQEFPEMSALYKEIHALLGVKTPSVIQGLFRLGYAKAPPPAPRWALHTRLKETSE